MKLTYVKRKVKIFNEKGICIKRKMMNRRRNKMKIISNLLLLYEEIEQISFHLVNIRTIKGLKLRNAPNLKVLDLCNNRIIEDLNELNLKVVPKLESLSFIYDPRTFKHFKSFPVSLKYLEILNSDLIDEIEEFLLLFFSFTPLYVSIGWYPGLYLEEDYEFLLRSNIKEIDYGFDTIVISPFILQKRETIRKRIWLIHNLFYFKRK